MCPAFLGQSSTVACTDLCDTGAATGCMSAAFGCEGLQHCLHWCLHMLHGMHWVASNGCTYVPTIPVQKCCMVHAVQICECRPCFGVAVAAVAGRLQLQAAWQGRVVWAACLLAQMHVDCGALAGMFAARNSSGCKLLSGHHSVVTNQADCMHLCESCLTWAVRGRQVVHGYCCGKQQRKES